MKPPTYLQLLGLMCAVGVLLTGCLIKPARVPTRHFVLAPIPAPEQALATPQPLLVEVGFVKMPAYLLRDSMIVRKSATEIDYLEDALWAERLDQSFRQTLADNVSTLLRSNQVDTSASERNGGMVRILVNVKQLDVDTQGRGTLIAGWRLAFLGSHSSVKNGQSHLTRPGPSPLANPQVIATTLSDLTAELGRQLAQAIRKTSQANP